MVGGRLFAGRGLPPRRALPADELTACLSAIDVSDLNAFSHVHREQAIAAAAHADITKPFGGVPIGVKELDQVAGWPDTHASVLFATASPIARARHVERIRDAGGAVLVGQTTASEFGGVNCTRTVINGATHNPWQRAGPRAARRADRRPPWQVAW